MLGLWGDQPKDLLFSGKIQGPLNPREKEILRRG